MDTVEVLVDGVRVHSVTDQHVVNLRERTGDRVLPIWIGPDAAHAISTKLNGIATERPMTHDLVVRLSDALAGRFERLVIHTITPFEEGKSQGVFIASLIVRSHAGDVTEVDCRPSDGVAIAVRTGIPIFVSGDVFEKSAVIPGANPT